MFSKLHLIFLWRKRVAAAVGRLRSPGGNALCAPGPTRNFQRPGQQGPRSGAQGVDAGGEDSPNIMNAPKMESARSLFAVTKAAFAWTALSSDLARSSLMRSEERRVG